MKYLELLLRKHYAALLIILILTTGISHSLSAQINYDINDRKLDKQALKKGELTTFQVKNINTFLYDITISGKSVNLFTTTPDILKPILFPSAPATENLDEEQIQPDEESFQNLFPEEVKKAIKKESTAIKTFKRTVKEFKDQLSDLNSIKTFGDELNTAIYTAGNDHNKMKGNLEEARKKISPSCTIGCEVEVTSVLQDKYKSVNNKYDAMAKAYNALSASVKSIKEINELKEDVDEIMATIKNTDYPTLITKAVGLYSFALSDDAFRASSDILPANGDEIEFTLKIKKKEDLPAPAPDINADNTFRVKVYGYWKADFSTGLFFNFDKSKFSQSYSFKDLPGDTTMEIVHDPVLDEVIPSIGALMHFYRKPKCNSTIGVSFGASTDDLKKLKYHLGASVFFLGDQRLVLTAGANAGRVDVLKSSYKVGQSLKKDTNLTEVPTQEVFKYSLFFSITWNLNLNE